MKFKKLLACGLLLITFVNSTVASYYEGRTKRDDEACAACGLLCIYCCFGSFLLAANQFIPRNSPIPIKPEIISHHDECQTGYLYGLYDAGKNGSPVNAEFCEGFKDSTRRNQIKKEFLESANPNLLTDCRSGYYEGLADGYTEIQAPNKNRGTRCSKHLSPGTKEKLRKRMQR